MRSLSGASLAAVAMLTLGSFTAACGQVNVIKARKAFKTANQSYQAQDYKKAAESYEEAIAADPDNKDIQSAYFFLGNSYDQQYKPSKKGEADNDALMQKAVENYTRAAERLSASAKPEDKKLGKLSLDYLVAAYGADKLNDPAKAEPVVQKMIQLDPGEPTNYFALAKIYEDAGAYEEAEKMLVAAKAAKPNDPDVYMQDLFHSFAGRRHSGQIRFEVINFGNLLKSDWGAGSRLVNTQILTAPSADPATGRLTYNLQTLSGNLITTPLQTSAGVADVYTMMLSFRYTFQ